MSEIHPDAELILYVYDELQAEARPDRPPGHGAAFLAEEPRRREKARYSGEGVNRIRHRWTRPRTPP